MLELYKNIKNERIKKGWTQTDLAKKVGYSDKSMIAKIEAGKVDLPQTKIRAFAEVFNCTESSLMGWESEEYHQIDFFEDIMKLRNRLISDEEFDLVESFRKLDEESKRQLVLMLAFLKDQSNKK